MGLEARELSVPIRSAGLDSTEAEQFRVDGFLGPYRLCTPSEMERVREHIDQEVLPSPGRNPGSTLHCRHLDQRVVYDLCAHPAILGRMSALAGPDLVLWSSNFWLKNPGACEIPWHQDYNYWPLEPVLNLSAWIAINEVTLDNACVQVIPGSHKKHLPSIGTPDGLDFQTMADPQFFDASQAVDMELRPGEFFLFNERLLHRSAPNRSERRRLGLGVRITLPFVRVYSDVRPLFPGHACILVSGEDRFGINRMQSPPQA
ncbi:MAG TPA: phytanoyl-CoA dioxygenase family protein [Polyangiaceae bacterium]|jgi:ectoine hydroxylase-related dioxygenase (phytanoyl-CoA dioxygenase family)